jgi:hypothetical protein
MKGSKVIILNLSAEQAGLIQNLIIADYQLI